MKWLYILLIWEFHIILKVLHETYMESAACMMKWKWMRTGWLGIKSIVGWKCIAYLMRHGLFQKCNLCVLKYENASKIWECICAYWNMRMRRKYESASINALRTNLMRHELFNGLLRTVDLDDVWNAYLYFLFKPFMTAKSLITSTQN